MGEGHPAGGSGALAGLIDKAGEALLADFAQYYHLDLVALLRPNSGWSPRRVLVLARQLPLESRTVAHLRGGDQYLGWGPDRYLLAALIDAVNATTYAVVAANSPKGKKPRPPEPVPRPEKTARARQRSNAFAETARSLANAVRATRGGNNGSRSGSKPPGR